MVFDIFTQSRFYSRRWEMVAMLFSGVLIVYTLRVNMSVAAQKMRDELGWSEYQKGLVLSAFYWGYALGQIPASILVKAYGAKWVFGLSVLIPAILTIFVPMACRYSFGLALFIRCIIGFFESSSFPAVFHFFPVWVPLNEKTLMIPAIISGVPMGEIIGFSASGVMVNSDLYINGYNYGDWPSVFYVFGLIGVAWFPYWALFSYETPEVHPRITAEELLVINKHKAFSSMHKQAAGDMEIVAGASRADFNISKASPLIEASNPMITSKRTISLGAEGIGPFYLGDDLKDSGSEGDDHDGGEVHVDFRLPSQTRATSYPGAGAQYTAVRRDEFDVQQRSNLAAAEEKERLISVIYTDDGDEQVKRTPWMNFFTHPVSLTLFINSWSFGWAGFTLLSEMPSYLTDVLGFDLTSAGILCIFPYMALFISALGFGVLFEYLQNHFGWTVYKVRQVSEYVALAGCCSALILCGFMSNSYVAYAFMIIAQTMIGAAQTGLGCAYSDVAPNYSSALNSIGNSIAAVAGIVGPIVVAFLTESFDGVWGWRLAFFLTSAMAAVSLIAWSLFMRPEPVPALNNPLGSDL